MSLADFLTPRKEVLRKEGIESVIDIENLNDQKKISIESRPEDFFDLTWPTSDIKLVIEHLNNRFNSKEKTSGLFLLEGFKGSGKSHIELLVYHLFKNNAASRPWLAKHNLECNLPADAIVSIHKFTDFPLDSIWSIVFESLGASKQVSASKVPNLKELQAALKGKKLVLILDELERGILSIPDENRREQNLGFLQMLSEESLRSHDASITIIASVYDSNKEPGSTLKRISRLDVKFAEPTDRQKIVFHRLFSNFQSLEQNKVTSIIQSYANQWKKENVNVNEKYLDKFRNAFPFTPELLDMLLEKVLKQNFQGNRGPLGLLGNMVRNMYQKVDVISAAHLDIDDNGIRNRLTDLDPGQGLIQCAQNDLKGLRELKYSSEIVASVLIGTLASSGNLKGIHGDDLAKQVLRPGDDINVYNATLQAFQKMGAYFQSSEGNYFFDVQEKPSAKIEYHSLRIDPKEALDFALDRWKKYVFSDPQAVVFRDVAQAKAELSVREKNGLKYILAPRRLKPEERTQLYHGLENRNQVILLEPKSDNFDALNNPDIIKWSKRAKASMELQQSASDSERKHKYEQIGQEDIRYVEEAFKKAGLCYVLVNPGQDINSSLEFQLERVGNATNKEQVRRELSENIFPRQRIEDHLNELLDSDKNRGLVIERSISEIRSEYRKTLGFPVLMTDMTILIDALKSLSIQKRIGLKNNRTRHCGTTPQFSGAEWDSVVVVEPFEDDKKEGFNFNPQVPVKPGEIKGGDETPQAEPISAPSSQIESTTVYTTNHSTLGSLRQEIAAKLDGYDKMTITTCRFVLFLQNSNADLGSLPVALRGTLSGMADLSMELDIVKQGEFSKAQVEQMAEQLPSFQGAGYKAELKLIINEGKNG